MTGERCVPMERCVDAAVMGCESLSMTFKRELIHKLQLGQSLHYPRRASSFQPLTLQLHDFPLCP